MTQRSCATEYSEYYHAIAPFDNRIGIMGGTFDPVHNGHIQMGVDAHDEFGLSKVLFIPTGRPPHKPRSEVSDSEHRMAMLELAANQPYMQPSRIEIDRKGTTYAVDTLTLLKKIFKEHEFYYIIGSDTLFQLHSWKNISQVLAMTHFIVFLRGRRRYWQSHRNGRLLQRIGCHAIFPGKAAGSSRFIHRYPASAAERVRPVRPAARKSH